MLFSRSLLAGVIVGASFLVSCEGVVAEGEGDSGEGEGDSGEGEGDVVGEGEGDVVGEGEGDVVGEGEGEGEGEGDVDVCAFAPTFRDILRQRTVVLLADRRETLAANLSVDEAGDLVESLALQGDVVANVDEALATIDQGEVRVLRFWELTSERGFRAVEYGRGDNSFGAFFAADDTPAARINDGDIADCFAFVGSSFGACSVTADCDADHACQGVAVDDDGNGTVTQIATGGCIPRGPYVGEGNSCTSVADCADVDGNFAGLRCANLTRGTPGFCDAAHNAGTFDDPVLGDVTLPIPARGALARELIVSGLSTVDTDVSVFLFLVHPDVTTLTVTLTNPIGTRVPVAADAVGGEIFFDGAVSGFSGDEAVNGRWVLSIEDGVDGDAGELFDYVLRIGSRDD